ncbi:MAG TPA: hypothetical protein VHG30_01945 [Microvirga sp.]|nr:hypothetical protein [Microvirga sp.]
MKPTKLLPLSFATLLLASAAGAHERDGDPRELGTVSFPTSCSPAAGARFERAAAMLHSFWYEEAAKEFTTVTEEDPGCAAGYWGIAMSAWYPLWYPPSEATLRKGSAAIARAEAITSKTEREADYIKAIGAFYRDWDKLDHRTRSLAYEKAMEQVHLRYPDDREAAVFYALALNATALPTDKTYANTLKAAAILEKVFAEQPRHPGVAHYLIHSYDYPPLAEKGLPAARSYAKLAPAVPHALHMPSHIFTRIGLWQESIDSNRASAAAAQAYIAKSAGPGVAWDQALHAMDYLAYSYLQTARDAEAKRVLDELGGFGKATPESLPAAYALAAIPARFALERRNWTEAAAVSAPPPSFPWDRFPWAEAILSFTRGLGAAKSGDVSAAQRELDRLGALREALVRAKNAYWADQVEVQRRAVSAMLARAEGRNEDALGLMRAAADLESSTEKHPVTPAPVVPARELLGDLLLELDQPAQALREYEASLVTEPNRFRSFVGAARAAELSGDMAKARMYYEKLIALGGRADTARPELQRAQVFVAK